VKINPELLELVQKIIDAEKDWETKFGLLTSIGIETTNDELFKACEEVRNRLPDNEPLTDEIW
jgi:hypothetical protein